jgi:hypothetical protein
MQKRQRQVGAGIYFKKPKRGQDGRKTFFLRGQKVAEKAKKKLGKWPRWPTILQYVTI